MLSPVADTMPTRPAATIYEMEFWHDRFGMSEEMADNMAYLMMAVDQRTISSTFAKAIHDEAIEIQEVS